MAPNPITPCAVSFDPPPELHPTACGTQVCLPPDEAKALTKWIAEEKELQLQLAGCSLVEHK